MHRGLHTAYTKKTPSHVILHVGTNDVTTKQDPQHIAESIINLAVKIKKL